MFKSIVSSLIVGLGVMLLYLPSSVQAASVTVSSPDSSHFFNVNDTITYKGEVVLVPPGMHRLLSFDLWLEGNVTPVVRAYDQATDTFGATLFTGTPRVFTEAAWTGNQSVQVTTTIPGGLNVVPGTYVFIGVTNRGPGLSGLIRGAPASSYTSGYLVDIYSGAVRTHAQDYDTHFSATFDDVQTVPTLSEWAMILLVIALGGAAVLILFRRGSQA